MSFLIVKETKVIINGAAKEAPKSEVDGETFTQLRRARTEESQFNWNGRKIDEVEISEVSVYDEEDVKFVAWFIEMKIKMDLSKSYIAPRMIDSLANKLNDLSERKLKVIEGSKIRLPNIGGFSGFGAEAPLREAAAKIGFTY